MGSAAGVRPEQRFTAERPCPVCGGHDQKRRGEGVRCYGFLSDDGEWAHCTRDEYAGDLERNPGSDAYPHKLTGDCRCGARHGLASGAERNGRRKGQRGRIVAVYDYPDEDGSLLYQTVRFEPKDFRQRRLNGHGGWEWNLQGVRLVPYRLPELIAEHGRLALVCAGEKDTDRAHDLGFTATTNPLGEGKWRDEYAEYFEGRPTAVIAHNDPPGRKHAEGVARSLYGKATSIKVLELPDVPEDGGDLVDWTNAGGDAEDLRQLIDETPEWSPPPQPEEVAWAMCENLARRENITADFADALRLAGVAGEARLLRLLYLTLTSRRLDKPVSVAVKGPSSGGKSLVVERVLDAFPEEAYYALTSMSEKALIYLDEDMRHRSLVIYEAAGMAGDMQTYLMRTLLSENRIRYQTAESTSKGVKPRLLEMEGPTNLIVTTTQTRMHPENETRLLSLTVTDTRAQTKDIFRAMADEDRAPVDLEPWRQLQVWLGGQPRAAAVPYAKVLAEMVPPVAVRLRRDFGAVLQLIRSNAILHQASREKDNKGRIVATLDDYAVVRELIADLVAEGVDATVNPTVRDTVRAVERLAEDKDDDGDEEEKCVGLKAIAEELKLDKASASRRVKAAREAGYLINLEDSKGKAAKLALGEPLPADLEILPKPEDLRAEWDRCTVATVQEGRGVHPDPSGESVAGPDCNGAQQCNGSAPKDSNNAANSRHSGEPSTQNTTSAGGTGANGGRGYVESATLQHPPEEAEKDRHNGATQHPTQHPTQHSGEPGVVSIESGEPYDLYVGRGKRGTKLEKSKWHNPFREDKPGEPRDGSREEVIAKHERYLEGPVANFEGKVFDGRHLMAELPEIKGKTLACHCAPQPCHADILLRLANQASEGTPHRDPEAWEVW